MTNRAAVRLFRRALRRGINKALPFYLSSWRRNSDLDLCPKPSRCSQLDFRSPQGRWPPKWPASGTTSYPVPEIPQKLHYITLHYITLYRQCNRLKNIRHSVFIFGICDLVGFLGGLNSFLVFCPYSSWRRKVASVSWVTCSLLTICLR